jgi:hypothetical protein
MDELILTWVQDQGYETIEEWMQDNDNSDPVDAHASWESNRRELELEARAERDVEWADYDRDGAYA